MNSKLEDVLNKMGDSDEIEKLLSDHGYDISILKQLVVKDGERGKDLADADAAYFNGKSLILVDRSFIERAEPQQIFDVLYHEVVHFLQELEGKGYEEEDQGTLSDPTELGAVLEDVKLRRSRGESEDQIREYLHQRFRDEPVDKQKLEDIRQQSLVASNEKVWRVLLFDGRGVQYFDNPDAAFKFYDKNKSEKQAMTPELVDRPKDIRTRKASLWMMADEDPEASVGDIINDQNIQQTVTGEAGEVSGTSEVPLGGKSPHNFPSSTKEATVLSAPLVLAYQFLKEGTPESKLLARENAVEFLRRLNYSLTTLLPNLYRRDQPDIRDMRDTLALVAKSFVESSGDFGNTLENVRQAILRTIQLKPYLNQHLGFLSHQLKEIGEMEKTAALPHKYFGPAPLSQTEQTMTPGEMTPTKNPAEEQQFTRSQNPEYALSLSNLPANYQLNPNQRAPSPNDDLRVVLKSLAMKKDHLLEQWLQSPDVLKPVEKAAEELGEEVEAYEATSVWSDTDVNDFRGRFALSVKTPTGFHTFDVKIFGTIDNYGPGDDYLTNVEFTMVESSPKIAHCGPCTPLKLEALRLLHDIAENRPELISSSDLARVGAAMASKDVTDFLKALSAVTPIPFGNFEADPIIPILQKLSNIFEQLVDIQEDIGNGSMKVVASVPGSKDFDFSSVQIAIPEREAKEVLKWSKENIPDSILNIDDGAHGREDYPHITVKYGIHSEDPKEVTALFDSTPAFKIRLGKISIFSNEEKPYDVVKVEVNSPELHELNKKIGEGVEVTDTFPEYKPHMTLAYVNKGEGEVYNGNKDFDGKEVAVKSIEFSSKNKEKGATPIQLISSLRSFGGVLDEMLESYPITQTDSEDPSKSSDRYPYGERALRNGDEDLLSVLEEMEKDPEDRDPVGKPDPDRTQVH